MFSREVVTYGIQYPEVSESPDWKPLHPEVKRALVKEISQSVERNVAVSLFDDQRIRQFEGKAKSVPSLKALFFHSSRWDPKAELHVWRYSWPLREMIKDTMDNIKWVD